MTIKKKPRTAPFLIAWFVFAIVVSLWASDIDPQYKEHALGWLNGVTIASCLFILVYSRQVMRRVRWDKEHEQSKSKVAAK